MTNVIHWAAAGSTEVWLLTTDMHEVHNDTHGNRKQIILILISMVHVNRRGDRNQRVVQHGISSVSHIHSGVRVLGAGPIILGCPALI